MTILHLDAKNNIHRESSNAFIKKVYPSAEIKFIDISDNSNGLVTVTSLEKGIKNLDKEVHDGCVVYANFTVMASEFSGLSEQIISDISRKHPFICAGGNHKSELDLLVPCNISDTIVVGALNKNYGNASFNSIEGNNTFDVMFFGTNQDYYDETGDKVRTGGTSVSSAYAAAVHSAYLKGELNVVLEKLKEYNIGYEVISDFFSYLPKSEIPSLDSMNNE